MKNFNELEIAEELKRAISDMGFTEPTQIQSQVIPAMLDGHDIVAQAPTGTGKTCAFALPIITNTPKESKDVKSLILCPTRELVIQIANEFKKFLKYTENVRVCAVYGGQNIDRQLASLRKKPQIIIATPGRALDHIERRTIKLLYLRFFFAFAYYFNWVSLICFYHFQNLLWHSSTKQSKLFVFWASL